MKKLFDIRIASLACAAALIGIVSAGAQDFPARFMTMVVPFGAGSGTDIVARIFAAHVSQLLGKQMVIENIAGAGGTTGVGRAAKAQPDGHQIVLGGLDTFAQSQYLFKKPPYNSITDFEPVALAIEQPLVLVVRKDLPVTNLKEFMEYAKDNPGKLRFGSGGIGGAPYLACSTMNAAIGVSATHVPYRSAAHALQDMLSGDIDYYCMLAISAINQIESKTVKVLAVLTRDRSPIFPDLPTAREQGLDVTDGYYWMAFFAPKGTPAPIVAVLNGAFQKALDTPEVQTRLHGLAATVVTPERRTSAYLKEYLASEVTKWAAIMKAADVPQQ